MDRKVLTDEEKMELGKTNPAGGIWNPEKQKWEHYKPTKGVQPNWNPFDPSKRRKRMTMKEKKFLLMLSATCSISEAYKSAYKYTPIPENKKLENARISAMGNQILNRLKKRFPEEVSTMTFEDITPDFVRKELMKLYNSDHATIGEKTRIVELMGKIHGMFTDKQVVESKVKDVINTVYQETDADMPNRADERIGRIEIEDKINKTGIA